LTWYADHAECDYFPSSHPSILRAIGWLEGGKPYTRATVEPLMLNKLSEFLKEPWQPLMVLGVHECNLCTVKGKYGHRNLFIPADGILFVCPELILHYIEEHGYGPPADFCSAILACPPMNSKAYLKLVEPIWQMTGPPW